MLKSILKQGIEGSDPLPIIGVNMDETEIMISQVEQSVARADALRSCRCLKMMQILPVAVVNDDVVGIAVATLAYEEEITGL